MDRYLKTKEKGGPRVFEVNTLSAFIEVATWLYSSPEVLFRGQTKERDWPLIPSAGRDLQRSRCLQREVEMLEEFKRESIPYLDHTPATDWQWLALAQHNRLPTRLLDWSTNPLVGLWFAVRDPPLDSDPGVVWAYSYREAVFNTRDLPTPFSLDQTTVYFPEHISPFIRAQAGAFTIHAKSSEGPERLPSLEETTKNADLMLTKIEIPCTHFPHIRYHLFRVGISPSSLFPGLVGIADKIRYDNMFSSDEKGLADPALLAQLAAEPSEK
ncbi:MAG TPA: FRG domain-containing protein [Thermoanaerobaculia bacterium]|nr:FRG domain-containing protein [Thermoanaerobaculia bacterium]